MGRGTKIRRPSSKPLLRQLAKALRMSMSWVSITPLGALVLPEV